MIKVSEAFRERFPGAHVGLLAMRGVANPAQSAPLEKRKAEIEAALRSQFGGLDRAGLKQLPVLQAYDAHYSRFDKTYHLLAQLESVAVKGKPLISVATLVEAMFMGELKNLLLTAGHDLEKVKQPLTLMLATGGEGYLGIRGRTEICKAGDMMIADSEGILSSVLSGPDARTRITPETRAVLFTVYAPEGITKEAVRQHLSDIAEYVRLITPEATIELSECYGTSAG